MSDISCAVCGEPWDVYDNGADMKKWEYKLFRAGAGCPCCEGVKPADRDATDSELETLKTLVFDSPTDEPEEFALSDRLAEIAETGTVGKKPEWRAPNPRVMEMCAGCGLEIIIDPDDERQKYSTAHVKKSYIGQSYYGTGGYDFLRNDEADTEPFLPIEGDERNGVDLYCPACIEICSNGSCQRRIFTRSELQGGDTYDPGESFPIPGDEYSNRSVCIDCFEELTSELEAEEEEEARRQMDDGEDDDEDDDDVHDLV